MALNFQGTDIQPRRGVNLTGRKTTGVRLSSLKKGQKAITIGEDVMSQMGITELGDKGIKVVVKLGSGAAWAGKLMIMPQEGGPFTLRYVNIKKRKAAHIMSSSLPFTVSSKAKYKVYADDKALVVAIPAADDEEGKVEAEAETTAAEADEGAVDEVAAEADAEFAAE